MSALLSRACDQVTARYDQIVVLGAGMDPDGTLHGPTQLRVFAGVQLYDRGIAPALHFSGGRADQTSPSAGAQMSKNAQALGVPNSAITTEDASWSTLQNALFSGQILDKTRPTLVVSEGFHLLRGHASFKWAGFQSIDTCRSTRFRGDLGTSLRMVLRESVAYPVNLARAGLYSLLISLGWPEKRLTPLLH